MKIRVSVERTKLSAAEKEGVIHLRPVNRCRKCGRGNIGAETKRCPRCGSNGNSLARIYTVRNNYEWEVGF